MATIRVDDANPTHHVRLYDGTNAVGLVLCDGQGNVTDRFEHSSYPTLSTKISQGAGGYDDMLPPFTPISQDDWSNGQGNEWLDEDGSAYWDSYGVNPFKPGSIHLGGMMQYGQHTGAGLMRCAAYWPRYLSGGADLCYGMIGLASSWTYLAKSFTAPYTATYTDIILYVRWRQSKKRTHNTGTIKLAISAALTSGTTYWIKVNTDANKGIVVTVCNDNAGDPGTTITTATYSATSGEDVTPEILTDWSTTGKKSTNGSSWTAGPGLFFAYYIPTLTRTKILDYYGGLFMVGTASGNSYLFKIGEHGVATGGSTTTLVDAGSGWTVNEWTGCIVKITSIQSGGTSFIQAHYARITSNTADTLTFTPALDVAVASYLIYAIVSSDKLTHLHTYTGGVFTDAIVADGNIYIAFGPSSTVPIEAVSITLSGVPALSYTYTTCTGYYGRYLAFTDYGSNRLLWVSNADGALHSVGYIATAVPLAGAFTNIELGESYETVTGLEVYGDYGYLWVFKESSIYFIDSSDNPVRVAINEMVNYKSWVNGRVHTTHGVYLYFSLQGGRIERYYNGQLDDIGPALHEDRYGELVALVGYPGMIYAAFNGGASDRSCIMAYNGQGWAEVWRSPATGMQIQTIYISPVPGDNVDRLWIVCDGLLSWLPIAIDAYTLPVEAYNYFVFAPDGYLITSKIRTGYKNLIKLYRAIQLTMSLSAVAYAVEVCVDYRYGLSSSVISDWVSVSDTATTADDYDELLLTNSSAVSGNGIACRWIQFRITFYDTNASRVNYDPGGKIDHVLVDTLVRAPVTYQSGFTFRLGDSLPDLTGEEEDQVLATVIAQLKSWAVSQTVLQMDSVFDLIDYGSGGPHVVIEPGSYRVMGRVQVEDKQAYIIQAQVIEVDLT